jgi:hypothetical protein
MVHRFLMSLAAAAALAACAAGGGEAAAPANQDRALQQRAAEQTSPIGPPPQSSGTEVAAEAANDPPPPAPGTIVVPGAREPTPLPPGDPRTTDQRMADIRAWDRCVMRAQAQMTEGQPGRLQDSPEEVCRRALGMADREAIPIRD